jgi:transcriptional regulator with XRE-family HTH domain
MQTRLQQLLDCANLAPARFAEIVGVQRSAVSHILSGRNNPSLDFIRKILENFPYLNSDWLITGNGEMFKNNEIQKSAPTVPATEQKSLFEPQNVFTDEDPPQYGNIPEKQEKNELNKQIVPPVVEVKPEKHEVVIPSIPAKVVERIVIFHNDGTFKEYLPEKTD